MRLEYLRKEDDLESNIERLTEQATQLNLERYQLAIKIKVNLVWMKISLPLCAHVYLSIVVIVLQLPWFCKYALTTASIHLFLMYGCFFRLCLWMSFH